MTIVRSHEPTWAEGDAWRVSAEPQLKIGVLHGPADYQLVDVTAAARQSDGDIVVVDGGVREVRLFDRDGTYVRTLGGPGSGPGEFEDPAQVLVAAADSIIVWDNAFYRASRFDSAGAFAGAQSVDRGSIAGAIEPPLYPGSAELLPDGRLVVRLVEKTLKGDPAAASRPCSGALKVSADLSHIDTLMFFAGIEQVSVDAPWGRTEVVPPLAKRTVIAVSATNLGICIGDQEGPEIECFGPDASHTIVRWTSEPAPVTEREIAIWRDTTGALLGALALPPIEVLEIGDDYVMSVYRDELEVQYLQVYELVKDSARTLDR